MMFNMTPISGSRGKVTNMMYEFETLANIQIAHEIVIPFVSKGSFFPSNSEYTTKYQLHYLKGNNRIWFVHTRAINRGGYYYTSRVVRYDVVNGDESAGSTGQVDNAGQGQRQKDETALFQADGQRDRRILIQEYSVFPILD